MSAQALTCGAVQVSKAVLDASASADAVERMSGDMVALETYQEDISAHLAQATTELEQAKIEAQQQMLQTEVSVGCCLRFHCLCSLFSFPRCRCSCWYLCLCCLPGRAVRAMRWCLGHVPYGQVGKCLSRVGITSHVTGHCVCTCGD